MSEIQESPKPCDSEARATCVYSQGYANCPNERCYIKAQFIELEMEDA